MVTLGLDLDVVVVDLDLNLDLDLDPDLDCWSCLVFGVFILGRIHSRARRLNRYMVVGARRLFGFCPTKEVL